MKLHLVPAAVLLLLVCPIAAQGDIRLRVLSYQWTTSHQPLHFSWQGTSSTSCSANTRVDGSVSSSGNFNAYGTSNGMCDTTFTPPGNETIDIKKPVVFILAETQTSRMILSCTRNVRWSQCEALSPGMFVARNENGHFEVESISKGKEVWTRYEIVQQAAIIRATPTAELAKAATPSIEPPLTTSNGSDTGFPSRWKSMTSGSTRRVRFEGDYIYAELILSEGQSKAGASSLTELKKNGDKFVGTVSNHLVNAKGVTCSTKYEIELTLATPSRIEGRELGPQPNSKIDWETCSYSVTSTWQSFVWIPIQ